LERRQSWADWPRGLRLVKTAKPGPQTTSATITRRTIFVNAVLRTVDKAMVDG
jgi:hypothetical protein